jgi:hypothetical protein
MQTMRRKLLKVGACGALSQLLPTGSALAYAMEAAAATGTPDDSAGVAPKLVEIMETRCVHHHPQFGDFYTGYPDGLFTWETFFDNIVLLHAGDSQLGKANLAIFLSLQREDGCIRRHWPGFAPPTGLGDVWNQYDDEEHAQPFLCQDALFLSRANQGDVEWITESMYAGLAKYLAHWEAAWRRDGSNLCVWASAPHSGEDNQYDRVGVWRSYFCAGTDLNSFLYLEYLAMARIAKAKGKSADEAAFELAAAQKKEAIQRLLWDETDGFYYDHDVRTGKQIRIKSVAGFMPLWAGIATEQQAKRLVEHLTNPKEFWTPYPVPSYARSERNYTQHHVPPPLLDPYYGLDDGHSNWLGGVWGHTNYFIVHGLQHYGFDREARTIAQKSYEMSAPDMQIREFSNAETGVGSGGSWICAGAELSLRLLQAELTANFSPMPIEDASKPISSDRVRAALGLTRKFRQKA